MLIFEDLEFNPKVIRIRDEFKNNLGLIYFHSSEYVYEPLDGIILTNERLLEINNFLNKIKREDVQKRQS